MFVIVLSYIQYYFPSPFSTDYVQLNWVETMFRLFSIKLGSDYVQLNSVESCEMSKPCSVIFRFCSVIFSSGMYFSLVHMKKWIKTMQE